MGDVRSYALGVARLVLLERRRQPSFIPIEDAPIQASPSAQPFERADTQLGDCLDRCLAALPVENRSLVLDYYQGERQSKIANRRRLAAGLGLSDNALRSRVQRVRDLLEACVRACGEERT